MNVRTLEERIEQRYYLPNYKPTAEYQIRAELDRLARQIRKLSVRSGLLGPYVRVQDVLDLIKAAKQ